MLLCMSYRDRLREIQMRSQVESLKLQRQARLQRNQAIRKQMEEFNLSLTVVSAKTQALRNLKVLTKGLPLKIVFFL